MPYRLIHGETIATLKAAKESSVDAIVCDPPYAIEFAGNDWDRPKMLGQATGISGGFQRIPAGTHRPDVSKQDPHVFQEWVTAWATEALRVLKPGGHLIAFGSPRTYHRLAAGLEDAGFEIRDSLMWLYGEGMPKGKDLTVEIDKHLGVEREVVGEVDPEKAEQGMARWNDYRHGKYAELTGKRPVTVPTSDEAKKWDGWTTQLKPMHEPIVLARAPLAPGMTPTGRVSKKPKTVAQALVEDGLGAINVAATAIVDADGKSRMPGNVILDEVAAEMVDDEALKSRAPSKFFYCPKAKPGEKNAGLEGKNPHQTVKPIAVMEWLIDLVTPFGGVVLDIFMGSGTTGIAAVTKGYTFVGIDIDPDYVHTAAARIAHWAPEITGAVVEGALPAPEVEPEVEPADTGIEVPAASPSFDIYCSQPDCGIGIDLGRPATDDEKALAWNCGPCAAKVAALVPA